MLDENHSPRMVWFVLLLSGVVIWASGFWSCG